MCRARLANVFPKQSYRWQYVVFTELFPQVNLLILAESKRISFPCSYNALRMRTPKSVEKVEVHSKKNLLAWVLENRAGNVKYFCDCLSHFTGVIPREMNKKTIFRTGKKFKISQLTVTKTWNKLKIPNQKLSMRCEFNSRQSKYCILFQLTFQLCYCFNITRLSFKIQNNFKVIVAWVFSQKYQKSFPSCSKTLLFHKLKSNFNELNTSSPKRELRTILKKYATCCKSLLLGIWCIKATQWRDLLIEA